MRLIGHLCALGEGGIELSAQLVAALQHRHNAALAAAVGDLHQLLGHPFEVFFDLSVQRRTLACYNS